MKTKLLASSATLDGIIKMIKQYFCADGITLKQRDILGPNQFDIAGDTGRKQDVRVIQVKGRFRFERIISY